jgi:hypothetical protein
VLDRPGGADSPHQRVAALVEQRKLLRATAGQQLLAPISGHMEGYTTRVIRLLPIEGARLKLRRLS